MSVIITPIDSSAVMEALVQVLKADAGVSAFEPKILRGEEINENPDNTPWIGVYAVGEDYPPRTLGLGNGFRKQTIGLAVVCQYVTRSSGAECQDGLEKMKQAVIGAILSDTSLGGTVQTVTDFAVRYAAYAKQAAQPFFQSAVINFTAEGFVGASGG